MKLCDLKPGMTQIDIVVEVVHVSGAKRVLSGGVKRSIVELKVKDETGTMTLVLWDEKIIENLKTGNLLQIKNGFVTSYRDEWRINVAKFGEVKKL